MVAISDGFYMERAERSLQAPLQKCRKAAPLKNAAKKAATKYAVNAALLKNAVKQLSRRCQVMSK